MGYWRERYGFQTQDFIRGVIAGIETYAVNKEGGQYVGIMGKPLLDIIEEVRKDLGWERDAVSVDPQYAKSLEDDAIREAYEEGE